MAQQGRRLDVFSFGLVLYWLLAGGRHPCGEAFERDYNILQVLLRKIRMTHLLLGSGSALLLPLLLLISSFFFFFSSLSSCFSLLLCES